MYSDSTEYLVTNLGTRSKAVRIIMQRDELLFDIANMAYVEGDIIKTEDEHDRHQITDIIEDGNRERIDRMLSKAFSDVVEATFPYSKSEIEGAAARSNLHESPKRYILSLVVADDFSLTTVEHLVHYIHEYMVSTALYDWMSITNPEAAEKWQLKATDAMSEIRISINLRTRRVRRTMSPF